LAPVANFTVDNTAPFCSNTVQFTDYSTNTPTSWLWNFGDGQTSTSQNPSHTYAANGVYTVSLKATNAIGNNTMTKTSYITINMSQAPTATGASRCGTGTLTLTASGANTLHWYDAASGGTDLATGASFTTPSLSSTTTYYVENVISETPQNVGPAVSGSSSNTASYLTFDVSRELTLISIQSRRQNSGNVTISLQNSSGVTLQSTSATIGTSTTTIPLNWVIPAGTGYRLVTPANSRLFSMTSGVSYPYSIAGLVSITGCNSGSSIYSSYFNWSVQGYGCASNRTPVVATINPTVTPSVVVTPSTTTICAGTNVSFTAAPTNGGTPTYQWKVNGSNVGTGSTYNSSSLSNGDIVTCVMTSSETCASPGTATSNSVTMVVNSSITPSVSVAASQTSICSGTNVTFTATPTNGGTPTYQWKLNGANVGTGTATYSNNTLANGDIVTCQMTSSESCASPTTATSNNVTMIVTSSLTPAVSVAASASTICAGNNVTFTATPTNGGTPTYQWTLNGSNVGTGASTYNNSSLANGDIVACQMTSSEACASPTSATSNNVTMVVNPSLTPTVSIAESVNNICAGTNVTFTPTPANGGTPSYQWKVNGGNVGTGSTYSSTSLNNGDLVTCVMTSSETCASPGTATSNTVNMVVNPALIPSVSAIASQTSICAGTNVTFTATPTNGGTPTYQWTLNGSNVGTGTSTYSNNSLSNGDIVVCQMTSSETCASPTTASSANIVMTVSSTLTPAVSVAASSTTICAGANVTFTATPTNGGTPTYQWTLNGSNVGTSAPTYSNSSLSNGDVVVCQMTSSETCASPTSTSSTPVVITVNTVLTPSVSVTPSATNICAGTNVTFTATPTNGGTPTYQWNLNGSNVGTGTSTYSNNSLNNGDVVVCEMTSSETCVTTATVQSSPIAITVNSLLTPTVSIDASATTICQGTNVTFTANVTNEGLTPSYQWLVNGSNVGTGSTFASTTLANGDAVSCVLTSSESCVTTATANSNIINMNVNSTLVPAVVISSLPAGPVCPGTIKEFTANPTNGGTPTYEWFVDGASAGTGSTLTGVYNDGQIITCTMTSTETCASPTTADASAVTVSIYTVTPVSISDLGGTLSSSATSGNQWYEQTSGIIAGATGQNFTPSVDGFYYVIVTDAHGCNDTSNVIEVIVTGIPNASDANFTFFPNPTSGRLTITFGSDIVEGTLKLENAIGELIYSQAISAVTGSTISIDFSKYAQGVYFVRIQDKNTEIRERVVYEK
jgi:PKD repeat protein